MNKSLRSMKSGAQAGFTLIELIVVIVILGILAATAIPKFIDMSTDARVAKMHAAAGAIKAGSALYHAQWLVNADPTKAVTMEGQTVTGANGYPTADAAGIGLAAGIATPDYVISSTGFSVSPDASRSGCSVTYTAATATAGPVIKDLADPTTCK